MKTILPFLYSMLLKKTIILEFIQPLQPAVLKKPLRRPVE